jgi:hypothetical protein
MEHQRLSKEVTPKRQTDVSESEISENFNLQELQGGQILRLQKAIGNHQVQQLLQTQRIRSLAQPHIQRVDFANPNWTSASAIKRSGEGAEGVIFVTFSDGQLIVKFIDNAAPAAFADQMLDVVSIKHPQSRYVPNTDKDVEARNIRALINANMHLIPVDKLKQVQDQLATRKYIQIQGFAAATPGDKLNARQKADTLTNAQVVQDMGRLALVDAFLGNYDRLSKTSINTGNFMIGNTLSGIELVAIDNDAVATKGSTAGALGENLKFILDPTKVKDLAALLVDKTTKHFVELPEGYAAGDIPGLLQSVETNLAIGIKDAAERVIAHIKADKNFFDDMKATEKKGMPGPSGQPRKLLRAEMKDRFKMLQSGYKKGGWDKLTADV